MKTYLHLQYLAELPLEWEMFQAEVVGKIETHFIFNDSSPPPALRKSCRLWDNVEKYGKAGQTTDEKIRCALSAYTSRYKHTLRICNIYCFSTTKTVSRTRLIVTFVRAQTVLSYLASLYLPTSFLLWRFRIQRQRSSKNRNLPNIRRKCERVLAAQLGVCRHPYCDLTLHRALQCRVQTRMPAEWAQCNVNVT
jgi:hypothetical protein